MAKPAAVQADKTRQSRAYLVAIAALALAVLGGLAMLGLERAARVGALAETRAEANSQGAILAAGLESELNKFSLVPRVLAADPDVADLLRGQSAGPLALNRRLAALARQTNAAAIYLMDARGTALAASNWDKPGSFVGSNYDFREYFVGALERGTASEFALGNTTLRPGLYLAERVGPAQRPLGVIAVKVEFDRLERTWRNAEDGVFVTDGEGIVLLTSNPDWRFKSVAGAGAAQRRDPARDAARFGVANPQPLALPGGDDPNSPVRMIEKIQPIAPTGWELHLLADPEPRLSVARANARLAGVVLLVLAGLAGAGAWLWQRQRLARAAAEVAAQTATLRDQLQQANRLATLGQITAGLGHEIRQPLAAMRAYAENGLRLLEGDRRAEAATNFDRIAQLAGRIGEITAEQLHFSRRSAEAPREIRLAEVIDGSLLLLRDQLRQHSLTLDLPPAEAAATTVRARHVQLEQVLVNLLQNAVQACAPEGRITLAITAAGETVRLSVTDTGPGVPAALVDTLFQPFVTAREDGIGLGLAIARDIMRQLGGDLLHEATATGARFTMVIPAA